MLVNPFMERALMEAEKAARRGEVPVGAVILYKPEERLVAACGNRTEEYNDPTAHAEMLVIREACALLGTPRLTDCELYVTLEPCPMCAQAISFARISRLYFGAYDVKGGGVDNGAHIFHATSCHHRPEYYGGIMERQSSVLLKQFFVSKR